ncbi:flippase [Anthocerotibacter panamensis]|uniref:flippase n=1 Tax=Anthocerotibacter panamensis TaxID=2857077 RepID=UPI001C4030B6|nr:flippase [Anthocerotibacter panamensis]
MKIFHKTVDTGTIERNNLQKIVANTIWLFSDRILRMIASVLVGVWIARYLGTRNFGLFSYASAFVALFSTFASLGLESIVVRDIVRYPNLKNEILGTAFVLRFIGGVLTLLSSVIAISLMRGNDTLAIFLVALIAASSIFQAFDTIDFWFQSQVCSKKTLIAKNTAFLFVAVGKVFLIQIQAPLLVFGWLSLVETILAAIGLVIVYCVDGSSPMDWCVSKSRMRQLLRDSWPIALSGLAIMIYMRIDQLMLGHFLGDRAVGIYSAAIRISEVFYFIPTAIVSSIFPSIIEVRQRDKDEYYERLKKLFTSMVWLAIAVSIILTIFGNSIVILLFGDSYSGSTPILLIHVWSSVFVFLGVSQGPWNVAENLTKLSLQRAIIGALINVGLNLILIPTLGGIGAAIATLISYSVSAFFANVLDIRTRRIFYLQLRSIFLLGF